MGYFFKGLESERRQFYVAAEPTDDFVQYVFDLQVNDVWRKTEATVCFVFKSPKAKQEFLDKFLSKFKTKEAAGGLVTNAAGEYLLIYSRERWSFPKGGIEWQEAPADAAIREVKEETGLDKAEILYKMPETYHTFSRRDGWMMKVTHWYRMTTTSTRELKPQAEEGILEVRWVSKADWINGDWDAYPLVRHIFEQEFTRALDEANTQASA